jgi:hypothetical protein
MNPYILECSKNLYVLQDENLVRFGIIEAKTEFSTRVTHILCTAWFCNKMTEEDITSITKIQSRSLDPWGNKEHTGLNILFE